MTALKTLILVMVGRMSSGKSDGFKELSDEELVVQIGATGNTQMFGFLYDRYAQKVYNKCYGFVKNADEAQDLAQEVFLKLYIQLNSFKGDSKFSTWLYSLTYNFCVNYVNRDKGRKMRRASDTLDDHEYHLAAIVDIEDERLYELKASKLEQALELIEPEDKAILLLKYQDDVSIKDLQVLLSLGESAVKMRLKRARIKIMEAYNKII